MNLSEDNKELAICGDNSLVNSHEINAKYLPHVIIVGTTKKSELPFLENRFIENENLFYICQNKTCLLPNTRIEEIFNSLKI